MSQPPPSSPATFGLGQTSSPASQSSSPGFGAARSAAASNTATVDASTPWVAAADGNLSLLQTSLQTLCLPITVADNNPFGT